MTGGQIACDVSQAENFLEVEDLANSLYLMILPNDVSARKKGCGKMCLNPVQDVCRKVL